MTGLLSSLVKATVMLVHLSAGSVGGAPEKARRLRVVVWGEPAEQALLPRLRGQTVDLAVDLIEADGDVPDAAIDGQVDVAQRLSRTHQADVVVWRSEGNILLFMATPGLGRLLTRSLDDDANPIATDETGRRTGARVPRSGTLEAAALIVRSALQSVLDGIPVGVPRAEPTVSGQRGAAAATAGEREEPDPLYFLVLCDGRTLWDGETPYAAYGVGGHVGGGWRRFTAGVTGMHTLERHLGPNEQPYWRQNIGLFVGVDIVQAGRARLTTELQSGVALYNLYRFLEDRVFRRPHFFLAGELRASFYAKATGRMRVPLWLGVGLDYVPGSPPITMDPDGQIIRETLTLQPRIMLGLGVEFW